MSPRRSIPSCQGRQTCHLEDQCPHVRDDRRVTWKINTLMSGTTDVSPGRSIPSCEGRQTCHLEDQCPHVRDDRRVTWKINTLMSGTTEPKCDFYIPQFHMSTDKLQFLTSLTLTTCLCYKYSPNSSYVNEEESMYFPCVWS